MLEGVEIPALETRPTLYEDLVWIWEAFCLLNSCRTSGMAGPFPIAFTEMRAMADELELRGSTRQRFFHRIGILDRTFLKHCQKQSEVT